MAIKTTALLSEPDLTNHPEENSKHKKNSFFSNTSVKKIVYNFIVLSIEIN